MSDPFAPTIVDRVKQAALLLIVLGVIATVGLFFVTVAQSGEQPVAHERMTIVGFGMGSGYNGSQPLVRAQDAQGLEHPVPAPSDIGTSCSIGDDIAIIRQGLNLRVGPEVCNLSPVEQ